MPFAPARTASGRVETVGSVSSRSSAVVSMRSPTSSARSEVLSPSAGRLGVSIATGSAGTRVWGAVSSMAKKFRPNHRVVVTGPNGSGGAKAPLRLRLGDAHEYRGPLGLPYEGRETRDRAGGFPGTRS